MNPYTSTFLGDGDMENIEVQNLLNNLDVEVQQEVSKIGCWHQFLIDSRHTWILDQTDQ